MIGTTQYLLEMQDDAFYSLNLALEKDSINIEPLYFLGKILMEREEYELAIKYLEIHNQSYNEAHPYFLLGSCFLKLNEPKESILNLSKAIELNQKDAHWFWTRSLANFMNHSFDKALIDCNQTIVLLNNDPEFFNTRAVIYLFKEDTVTACQDYKRALERGFERGNDTLDKLCEKYL